MRRHDLTGIDDPDPQRRHVGGHRNLARRLDQFCALVPYRYQVFPSRHVRNRESSRPIGYGVSSTTTSALISGVDIEKHVTDAGAMEGHAMRPIGFVQSQVEALAVEHR